MSGASTMAIWALRTGTAGTAEDQQAKQALQLLRGRGRGQAHSTSETRLCWQLTQLNAAWGLPLGKDADLIATAGSH